MAEAEPRKYWAFISYSHQDKRVAIELQRRLARARIPKALRTRTAGGHATAFRGNKGHGALAPLSAPLARIHREMKTAFDPDRIFNPGRLYPDL